MILNAAAACLFALLATTLVAAQTLPAVQRPRVSAPAEHQMGTTANGTNADEEFDLNITERRITETNFHAETAVEIGDDGARALNLRVGVSVRADEIDVLLRNVQGHVRFRASLEQVLRLLDSRRGSQQQQPPATSSPSTWC